MMIIAVCCITMTAAAQDKQLYILHTNDTHSVIYPLSENLADTALAGRGGYIRRVTLVNNERKTHPDLLLFDSGDFSQGSPYYSLYKGDVEIGLMNLMGYDAATIGNHEFDFGLDNMARIFRMAKFPIVCCNYDFTGTPVEGTVKPYIVLKRNGVKIGVFGVCPEMEGLVSVDKFKGVKYLDPIAESQKVADLLKNKLKCDVVICISHLGWNTVNNVDDNVLMKKTRNIDIVLGGHSHTYLQQLEYETNLDGKRIPNDQNGKHGLWVGRITMDLKKK